MERDASSHIFHEPCACSEESAWESEEEAGEGEEGKRDAGTAAALQPLLPGAHSGAPHAAATQSLLGSLTSVNFWLLFVIFGSGTGCGLLLLLNLGMPALLGNM